MPGKYAYETGARKSMAVNSPDPSDDFSQDAAANKRPAEGIGNSDKGAKKQKKPGEADKKKAPQEREHVEPPPRDVGEAPAPNPNGKPVKTD